MLCKTTWGFIPCTLTHSELLCVKNKTIYIIMRQRKTSKGTNTRVERWNVCIIMCQKHFLSCPASRQGLIAVCRLLSEQEGVQGWVGPFGLLSLLGLSGITSWAIWRYLGLSLVMQRYAGLSGALVKIPNSQPIPCTITSEELLCVKSKTIHIIMCQRKTSLRQPQVSNDETFASLYAKGTSPVLSSFKTRPHGIWSVLSWQESNKG